MENFIIIAVLFVVIGAVIFYIVKSKKRGDKCIGCPYAKQCDSHCDNRQNNKDI